MRVSVIRVRDRAESFLTSCIPYLQFDHIQTIYIERASLEVNSNCAQVVFTKNVLRKSQQKTCFARVALSYEDYLIECVESACFLWILLDSFLDRLTFTLIRD